MTKGEKQLLQATVAIIKPPHADDGHIVGEVLQRAASAGIHPTRMWMGMLSERAWREFYSAHEGKDFFEGLITHMTSGYCLFMVLSGVDAVSVWREVMEDIRKDFSEGGPANVVHGSDSIKAANEEYGLVFTGVP